MPRRENDIAIRLSLKDGETVRRALDKLGKDGQAALSRIEKQSKPASKALLAVNAVTGELRASMAGASARLGAVGSGLGALGPAGLAGAAGIAAVVGGLTALSRASRRAIDTVAAIKDQADQAGVAASAFQELSFAAEKYSVTQEALTDGLKELALRADEFADTGKGSAAEAFRRLGFTQEEINARLGDTSKLFNEVVKRTRELGQVAGQIRVADEIFGGQGGEQFVRLLGADLAKLRQEARDLGLVIDDSLIARADQARDKLATLEKVVDVQLNQALVDLAPLLVSIAQGFADVARWVGEVVEGFRSIENKSRAGIEDRLAKLDEILARGRPRAGHALRVYNQQLEERLRLELRLEELTKAQPTEPRVTINRGSTQFADTIKSLQFELDQLGRTDFTRRLNQSLKSAGVENQTIFDDEFRQIFDLTAEIQKLTDAKEAEKQAEQDRQALMDRGAALTKQFLTTQEALAARIKEINDLRAAGAITAETAARTIEDAERRKLDASTDAADGIKRALRNIAEESGNAASQIEGVMKRAFSGMEDALADFATTGKLDFKSLTDSIIRDLVRMQVQSQITSRISGFLNGIFGGPGSAGGGTSAPVPVINEIGAVQIAHDGGIIGEPGMTRLMPLSLFTDAPRFHDGGGFLGPKERAAVLEDGEEVLTERSPRHIKNFGGYGGDVYVNTSIVVEAQPGQQGGLSEEAVDEIGQALEKRIDQAVSARLAKQQRVGGQLNRQRMF